MATLPKPFPFPVPAPRLTILREESRIYALGGMEPEYDPAFPIANIVWDGQVDPASVLSLLRESIPIVGVLNPVRIHKESNTLLQGRARVFIAKELGLKTVRAYLEDIEPNSDEAKRLCLTCDLERKYQCRLIENVMLAERKRLYEELYPETKRGVAGAMARHGRANEKTSFAGTQAQIRTRRTIQSKTEIGMKIDPEVVNLAKELMSTDGPLDPNGDGTTVKRRVWRFANNESEQKELIKHPDQLAVFTRYIKDDAKVMCTPINSIKDAARSLQYERNIGKYKDVDGFPMVCVDFTASIELVTPGSAALILTDMPYSVTEFHLLDPLFKAASIWLNERGHLAVMYGNAVPEFYAVANPLCQNYGLVWRGQIAVVNPPGAKAAYTANETISTHKCVAVFAKPHTYQHALNNTIVSLGADKLFFDWQQPLADFVGLVERLSNPNDLVVDPMAGSGTTLIAAQRQKRQAFGIEINQARYEIAKTRWIEEVLREDVASLAHEVVGIAD